jgi:hypothetical protein
VLQLEFRRRWVVSWASRWVTQLDLRIIPLKKPLSNT